MRNMRSISYKFGLHRLVGLLPILTWWFCAIIVALGFVLHKMHTISRADCVWIVCLVAICSSLHQTFNQKSSSNKNPTGNAVIELPSISAPKIRLIPFEWILVFPITLTFSLATYFLLTKSIDSKLIWASVIHSMLCVSWYVQYRLADLQQGNKKTFILSAYWLQRRYGIQEVRHLPAAYFLITAFISLIATLHVDHIFLLSSIISLIGAVASWRTNPHLLASIIYQQVRMSLFIIAHAIYLFFTEAFLL